MTNLPWDQPGYGRKKAKKKVRKKAKITGKGKAKVAIKVGTRIHLGGDGLARMAAGLYEGTTWEVVRLDAEELALVKVGKKGKLLSRKGPQNFYRLSLGYPIMLRTHGGRCRAGCGCRDSGRIADAAYLLDRGKATVVTEETERKAVQAKRAGQTGKWQLVYQAWNAKGGAGPEHGYGDYAEHAYFLGGYYNAGSRREAMRLAKEDWPQARFGGGLPSWFLMEPGKDQFKHLDGDYKDYLQGRWKK
jgi:hypothetical protein